METLSGHFLKNLQTDEFHEVITVIGSGGKTSFIWRLVQAAFPEKVLVSPTTRMFLPEETFSHCVFAGALGGNASAENGVKAQALPPPLLESAAGGFRLVLIEGDGSRGLPLKAWAGYEPVVPRISGKTVGIIPLPLGLEANEKTIHRFALFSRLTGIKEGEKIILDTIAAAITGRYGRGLFAAAKGRRILFLNQIEDERAMNAAEELVSLLPAEFLSSIDEVIAGSVKRDAIRLLYP